MVAVLADFGQQRGRGESPNAGETQEDFRVGVLGEGELQTLVVIGELAVEQADELGEHLGRVRLPVTVPSAAESRLSFSRCVRTAGSTRPR